MATKIEAAVTFVRRMGGGVDSMMSLQITDKASRTKFVDLEMSLEDFALMITGQGYMPATGEVRGLQNVGKVRVSEPRTVEYTGEHHYRRKEQEEWLRENCQEEGWILDSYLGSQGSKSFKDGKTYLHYGVYKFVDKKDDDASQETEAHEAHQDQDSARLDFAIKRQFRFRRENGKHVCDYLDRDDPFIAIRVDSPAYSTAREAIDAALAAKEDEQQ